MTRDEKILEALTAWQPQGDGPHSHSIALEPAGAAIGLTAERVDALSCQLRELAASSGPARAFTPAELTERAVTTAARVTGLLEPLKLYEVDATAGQALLRSATPTERGGRLFYYELLLSGLHAANLKRYSSGKPKANRESVPFALTHETIAKLADDLTRD
jgi:hypothetical protein